MIPEFALWQQIALAGLALLSLVYVFYFRIWTALAVASDLLFAAALAGCIASVAIPPIFEAGARRAVDVSPLPEALLKADAKVAALESLPRELIRKALERVGYDADDAGLEADTAVAPPTPGPFESRVRPAVEELVAVILRAASCAASLFLLLMALALRSSTATARELAALGRRLDGVEANAGRT